ncbi:MAG: hypothetical protein LBL39_00100 [Planctomycetaceae bacterium]|nr:hypothetical protein [Planctomycetaceae bacterium]
MFAVFGSSVVYSAIDDEAFIYLITMKDPDIKRIRAALDAGADVNAKLKELPAIYYAIFVAQASNDTSIAKLLIERNADVNVKVNLLPLLHSVLWGFDEKVSAETAQEIVSLLVNAGADLDAVDMTGNTPLVVLEKNQLPYAKQLIKILQDAKAGDTTKPSGKTTISGMKLNLNKFTVELPVGWSAKTDKETGAITFVSSKIKTMLVINFSDVEEVNAKELIDSVLLGFSSAKTPKRTQGGYYESSFTSSENIYIRVLVGVKDGLADTFSVMGNDKHAEVQQILRSIKPKNERPYFEAMINEIVGNMKPTKQTRTEPIEDEPTETANKITKQNFEHFTVEVPDGWQNSVNDESGEVTFDSPKIKTMLMINLLDMEGVDSKTLMDTMLSEFSSKAPERMRGGYYKSSFTVSGEIEVDVNVLAGAKDGLADTLWIMGNDKHREVQQILRSIKPKKKRPYLEAMIDNVIGNTKPKTPPEIPVQEIPPTPPVQETPPIPETPPTPPPVQKIPSTPPEMPKKFSKQNFDKFSIDVPSDWKSAVDTQTGVFGFISPNNTESVIILLIEREGKEYKNSKTMIDAVLEKIPFATNAKLTKGGYYKSSFTNPSNISGYVLVGAKNGVADAITVAGDKPEIMQTIRSIKLKTKRPYLDAMIKSIVDP